MRITKMCKKYFSICRGALILFCIISIVGSLMSIFTPYILGSFMDILVKGKDYNRVIQYVIAFAGLSISLIIKDYAVSMLGTRIRVKMAYVFNMDVVCHIQRMSASYFENEDISYLHQRINGDCNTLIGFCVEVLKDAFINSILLFVPLAIMASINMQITIVLCCFALAYFIVFFLMKKKVYVLGRKQSEKYSDLWARIFEQLKYATHIKTNSLYREFHRRAEDSYSDYYGFNLRNSKINYIYNSIGKILETLAQLVLLVMGGVLILRGRMTIGMFTVFSAYFRLVFGCLAYFFGLAASYQNAGVAYDRIQSILSRNIESNGAKRITAINKIEVKGISFGYSGTRETDKYTKRGNYECHMQSQVIDNLSCEFVKGKIYALSGKNGIGKTTLLKLIMGLYIDERQGKILYDGVPIEQIDMIDARRQLIGYVEQEPLLLEGSVTYNINYCSDEEKFEDGKDEIVEYGRWLNLEKIVNEEVEPFIINWGNNNLSGGECQKIAIIRALYRKPELLIMDEPTASLDKASKERLLKYLKKLKDKKIIIIVTHDDEILYACDEVVRFA